MKYLLDTCCISDFVKGDENTLSQIKNSSPSDLAISSITVMEIQYGLLYNPQRAKKISKIIHDLTSCLVILAYEEGDAQQTAIIRAKLRKEGTPIGSYDLLIAGSALRHELVLVTSNEKEFKRVPNLKISNWHLS